MSFCLPKDTRGTTQLAPGTPPAPLREAVTDLNRRALHRPGAPGRLPLCRKQETYSLGLPLCSRARGLFPSSLVRVSVLSVILYYLGGGLSTGGCGWEWPQSAVKGNQQEQRGFPLWDGEGDSCIWQYQNDYKRLQRLLLPHKEFPVFEGNTCFFLQEQGYNGADQR